MNERRETNAAHFRFPLSMLSVPTSDNSQSPSRWRRTAVLLSLLVVVIIGAAITWHTRLNWTALHEALLRLNPVATIAAMAVLPLGGFSIAAVDLIAGAKFGFWGGTLVIAGVTLFHLLASHLIARKFFRAPFQRMLARHHERLPFLAAADERALSVLLVLVPGPPYFVRNYLLALSDIPLRIYFWIALPLYLLRASVTLAVGDLSGDLSRRKLYVLGSVYLVKLIVCGLVVKHFLAKRKIAAPPAPTEIPVATDRRS